MIKSPKLYLAGKIKKNDFRHQIVHNLSGHDTNSGYLQTEDFTYIGPFFVACDHGCYHSPNSHGSIAENGCMHSGATQSQAEVIRKNNAAIDSADLVFAYITTTDCYGTLIEIGRATSTLRRPRLAIAFAPGIPVDDLWYCVLQADSVHYSARECCLRELLSAELKALQTAHPAAHGVTP